MKKNVIASLSEAGLRKTSVRIKVLQLFQKVDIALSSQEIENRLKHIDRITLYRTLRTFEQKGIIHQINDGTLHPKYAACQDTCTADQHFDRHAHFHCLKCGVTRCLPEVLQPRVKMPCGFVVETSQYTLQGSCPDCAILENEDPN